MAITTQKMVGKVQTVSGPIDAEDLGITLPHEHVLVDTSPWFFVEPKDTGLKKLAYEPVTPKNLSWLWHNCSSNLENVRLLDEKLAIEELIRFKEEGGSTVVEVTSVNLGRDPSGLLRISSATGLNIVMGSGYYQGVSPVYDQLTEEEITHEIVTDIQVGVGNSNVCAGIIGEIGCSWPLTNREKKSLRAAALAQQRTGVAITCHSSPHVDSPLEIIKELSSAGADVSRVVISHVDRVKRSLDTLDELAKTGCYLEYDLFGGPLFDPIRPNTPVYDRLCDRERIEQIIELINQGYLEQILISQDLCMKIRLIRYGGNGYAHILCNIIPQMLARGITTKQIHTILIENPKRMLCRSL